MERKINVTKPFLPPMEEYINEITDIWEASWLTNMGPKHQQLEAELKKYLGVDSVTLFTNGHLALELAIQAYNLKGEVITTPFTFASTTHAIVRNGLTPIFCDISYDDLTIDVNKIEGLITENTSAIVPVHVYGNICDVEQIELIAKKYNLKVIYDSAHAFGEKYKGKSVAEYGDASMFSFHATKVYHTIEGGAVCFKDKEIENVTNKLKNFGIKNDGMIQYIGSNAKMNEFQAAMGICNLRVIDKIISKRKLVTQWYEDGLKNIGGIRLNRIQENVESNYSYFPIIIDEISYGHTRDELCDYLADQNIYARKYFYPLTSSFECFDGKYNENNTPVAKYVSQRVLTLPLYPTLEEQDVQRICKIIREYKNK